MGVTLADLDKGQAVIKNQIDNLEKNSAKENREIREDLEEKHVENRASIHKLRTDLQKVCDEVWKLKIKIAGYAAIGGAVASVAGHYIEKMFQK